MIRLFVALLLPDDLKKKLADLISQLRPLAGGIKWVEPENLHLTLKFIGERPETDVAPIIAAIEAAIVGRKGFDVPIKGCGGFPNLRNPRVIWVGMENADPAVEMAAQIDSQLQALEIPPEDRPFSPHLTIGRVKMKTNLTPLSGQMEKTNFDAGILTVDRVGLVKSTLMPHGPIYENLKVFKLE
jgi:RNA 2',3'-cyclic 3'-phosphodiesterase